MATLKEFEEALRERGMNTALSILEELRKRDRATRKAAPARRVSGLKMTPDLAQRILTMHATTTMTQQEIAFKLGVNQGRVNEVIKHRKWLTDDPKAPESQARDKALARIGSTIKPATPKRHVGPKAEPARRLSEPRVQRAGTTQRASTGQRAGTAQLAFIDL